MTPIGSTRRCDVCFLTDLRFPGGSASSTLDEVATLRRAGLRVLLQHCPSWMHRGKPISERYAGHADICLTDVEHGDRIEADTVVVRHPLVVCADDFPAVAARVTARKAAFIVNNSTRRASGEPAYDVRQFVERFRAFPAPFRAIFPIGPVIRGELERALPPDAQGSLGPFDWTPTFDLQHFAFRPRKRLEAPYRIGRHGRDSAEKWLQDPSLLAQAYPAERDFTVLMLGGADGALKILKRRPRNWTVLPFGAMPVPDYLGELDAFVYFPHTDLHEAFGRTIVEAMMAGVPCILPRQLGEAFDELAFFCEPTQVASVVRRLAEHDALRLRFLEHAHDVAAQSFASGVLFTRLERLDAAALLGVFPVAEKSASLDSELLRYKGWVEGGTAVATE